VHNAFAVFLNAFALLTTDNTSLGDVRGEYTEAEVFVVYHFECYLNRRYCL